METMSNIEKEQNDEITHHVDEVNNNNDDNNNKTEGEPPKTTVVYIEAPPLPVVYKKGAWSKVEDEKLRKAVEEYGCHNWTAIERYSGLARQAKNCRLRWYNYLRPNLKRCPFTEEEERTILYLHDKYGNSWSRIAAKLPGRSDNEIKNFWYKINRNKAKKESLSNLLPKKEDEQSTTNENQNHHEADSNDEYFPGDGYTPTNLPSPIQQSSQVQPSAPNASYYPADSYLSSPDKVISTPHSQLYPSPSTFSTPGQHTPTNNQLIQMPTPNTPTSQLQNSPSPLLSPHQYTLSIPHHVLAPSPQQKTETAPGIPAPSHQQTGTISNTFPIHRNPPTLSTPRDRFKRLLSLKEQSSTQVIQTFPASSATETAGSVQIQPPLESLISPLKLKLSPPIPVIYSVQNTHQADISNASQNTETLAASLSAFQLKSPTGAPLSPLKLCLSIPVPSNSCIPSNISIPDSGVQLNSSTATASNPNSGAQVASLTSPHLKPSSCSLVLLPTQHMTFDSSHITHLDSAVKAESPSVQFYASANQGCNSCFQEEEADSDSEIQDALREAQAKVKFLKKKLRKNRTLYQKTSPKESSSAESFLSGNLATADSAYRGFLGAQVNTNSNSRTRKLLSDGLRVKAPGKNSKIKDVLKRISRRDGERTGVFLVEGGEFSKFQNGAGSESGSYSQDESTETEELPPQIENSQMQMYENMRNAEEKWGQSSMKTIVTRQELGPSTDSFDHIDLEQIMNSNLDAWDGIPSQVPEGNSLNECSRMGDVLNGSSTLLYDNFLMDQLLGQTSGGEGTLASRNISLTHHTDALQPIYCQSTTTTFVKSGDESNQLHRRDFGNHFEQESFPGQPENYGERGNSMSINKAKTATLDIPSMMMHHQNPTSNNLNSGCMSSEPMIEFGYNGREQYPVQISDGENLARTFSFNRSNLSSGQYPTANLQGFGFSGFTKECRGGGEEYPVQTSGGGYYQDLLQSSNTWKQEPLGDQSLNQGFLGENIGEQGPRSSEEQKLLVDRCQSAGLCTTSQPLESMNLSGELRRRNTGGVPEHQLQHDQQPIHHDHTDIMQELSSMLEFFPTTVQTPEWYSNGDFNSSVEASKELDKSMKVQMPFKSTQSMTTANYI